MRPDLQRIIDEESLDDEIEIHEPERFAHFRAKRSQERDVTPNADLREYQRELAIQREARLARARTWAARGGIAAIVMIFPTPLMALAFLAALVSFVIAVAYCATAPPRIDSS